MVARGSLVVWAVAVALSIAAVTGFELFLRGRGYVATIQDDEDLWAIQFDRLRSDPRGVALVGASRIQFAIDPSLLSRELAGRTVAMLAINGRYPLATLRALAAEEEFAGLVFVGIDSRGLTREHWTMQQSWIDHYRERWSAARRLHRVLLNVLQPHLVCMRSSFAAVSMVRRWLARQGLPFNDYVVLHADRVGFTDYRRTDAAAIRDRRIADLRQYYRDHPVPPPEQWVAELDEVSGWIRRIQARGGEVVFFREPASGEHLTIDETAYPRERYWDVYAGRSPAKLVDFRDVPDFLQFELPDTSHIDGVDVPRFTEAVARLIRRAEAQGARAPERAESALPAVARSLSR